MDTKIVGQIEKKFYCSVCDYTCSMLQHMKQHVLTGKHQRSLFGNKNEKMETSDKINTHHCICGKVYSTRGGLWKHKRSCKNSDNVSISSKTEIALENYDELIPVATAHVSAISEKDISLDKRLIVEILHQNQEFKDLILEQNKQNIELQKQLIELSKEGKYITHNTHHTTNNKFNLNIFLNEHCKDALNIMDFVNSLKLQLSDLECVGELGYVEGISKIFVNGLRELDVFKRPIHCSDVKRETLYVKDKDVWEKENERNERLKLAIKHIAHKNMTQVTEWRHENPDYKDADSVVSEQYMKIICESAGGYTEAEDDKNYNRIISKVAKETVIDKNSFLL